MIFAAGKLVRELDIKSGEIFNYEEHRSTVTALEQLSENVFGTTSYCALRLFDFQERKLVEKYEWQGSLISLKFNPLENYAVCGSQESTIHIWDLRDGQELNMHGFQSKIRHMSFHSSGCSLANADGNEILIWDFTGNGPAGKKPKSLSSQAAPSRPFNFSRVGTFLHHVQGTGSFFFGVQEQVKSLLPSREFATTHAAHRHGRLMAVHFVYRMHRVSLLITLRGKSYEGQMFKTRYHSVRKHRGDSISIRNKKDSITHGPSRNFCEMA